MFAALALLLATTATHGIQLPITSHAALDKYLQTTPLTASPLGKLSPGGRKRFLAELQFGPRGLTSTPLDDPSHELTHAQIVKLYKLFGVAHIARQMPDLGLTSKEQARRRHERQAAAKARGCTSVARCPESVIEQHYDQFMLHRPASSLTQAQKTTAIRQQYDRLFAADQTAARLRSMSRPDLRLLKRAAESVVFWVPDNRHISQLRQDLAEMQRRGMAHDRDYTDLYQALVSNRQFDLAGKLAQKHPGMDVHPLPLWTPPAKLPPRQPTAVSLAPDGRTMTRKPFDLSVPLRIVIVASCHFSQDAARAIKRHPQLRHVFAQHAIWLADQSDSIDAAKEWNQEFPHQPIHIAWNDHEWSMLDSWAMPTFYVFRHGRLIDQWAGWPADTGMKTLRQHLENDGVLSARD